MAAIDIFDNDAFSAVELSDRVTQMPHVPGQIGELGLFETKGIRTTDLGIEQKNGTLSLIPYTDRDAPDNIYNGGKRKLIKFEAGHFPLKRVIRPSEVQNIRAYGEESELEDAQSVVDEKMQEMVPYHDATLEYQRLGALKGYLLDSNGTDIIENLYDRFAITPGVVDFALDDTATKVRVKCLEALGLIEDGLGGVAYIGARALCGPAFFAAFISHPDVEKAYANWNNDFLRTDPRYAGFSFGGILWQQYRGKVNGVAFIAEDECQIFPFGVPGMYITRLAPANMIQFANTPGLPRYGSIEILKHGRGVEVLTESDPISITTRPGASIKGTK